MDFNFDFVTASQGNANTGVPSDGITPHQRIPEMLEIVDDLPDDQLLARVLNVKSVTDVVADIEKNVKAMSQKAESLSITSDATLKSANEMLIQCRVISRRAESRIKKHPKYVSAAAFKNGLDKFLREHITKKISGIEGAIKPKIGRYAREQQELARRIAQKKADEEAARLRKEAETRRQKEIAAQKKAKNEALARKAEMDAQAKAAGVAPVDVEIPEITVTTEDPAPVVVAPQVSPNTKTTIDGMGSASVEMIWTFSIVEPSKIPHEYLIPDTKKIAAAVKAGTRDIPGIKIFQEPDVNVRSAKGSVPDMKF